MSVFVTKPCCFDYRSFILLYKVWGGEVRGYTSCFFFSCRIALTILGLLWFHINFGVIRSNYVENVMSNLIMITFNPWIALGGMAILNILPIKEDGVYFHFFESFWGFFLFWGVFWATLLGYGSSQARDQIQARAASYATAVTTPVP